MTKRLAISAFIVLLAGAGSLLFFDKPLMADTCTTLTCTAYNRANYPGDPLLSSNCGEYGPPPTQTCFCPYVYMQGNAYIIVTNNCGG